MGNTNSILLERVIEAINKRMSAEDAGLMDGEAFVQQFIIIIVKYLWHSVVFHLWKS